MNDNFLLKKLEERRSQKALRQLSLPKAKIDFCSNDYLGMVSKNLVDAALYESKDDDLHHGSTGSRLLSGNYPLLQETEKEIAAFHEAEAGLIFNSGYDANLGLLSCIASREDTIIYDYLSHASIRDGIRLSLARSFSFIHNDVSDLEKKLKQAGGRVFVVTESVFSMDGDLAPLEAIADKCEQYQAALIVDEAHATGVIGTKGEGLVQQLSLQSKCFARIHTFGKGCGTHGAIILGSYTLKDYLVNFSRAFIYTTALPAAAVAAIRESYRIFPTMNTERDALKRWIGIFQSAELPFTKIRSDTAIQAVVIPGNDEVKNAANILQENDLDVRPILYPTVPRGGERLRVVLHSFNTEVELHLLIKLLTAMGAAK